MNEPVVIKLHDVDCAELRLEDSAAVICRKCVAYANRQTTGAVAAQEVRSGRFTSSPTIAKLWSFWSRSVSRVGGRHSAKTSVSDQDEYLGHGRHGDHDDDHQTSTSDVVSTASTNRRAMSDGDVLLFDPTQLCEENNSSRDHSSGLGRWLDGAPRVWFITDASWVPHTSSQIASFVQTGVEVRVGWIRTHEKLCIVDDEILISANAGLTGARTVWSSTDLATSCRTASRTPAWSIGINPGLGLFPIKTQQPERSRGRSYSGPQYGANARRDPLGHIRFCDPMRAELWRLGTEMRI